MKKLKEKATIEDTEYVSSLEELSYNSHESDNIPPKSHIEKLFKKRKTATSLN